MDLNSKQVRHLRSLAHKLDPAVQCGKEGATPAFYAEVTRNLKDHELIKVRLGAEDRTAFKELADQVAAETGAALVQTIGRVALLFRAADEPKIKLP